jgi:hypothetical protein
MPARGSLFFLAAIGIGALGTPVDIRDVVAAKASIAPAATTVPTDSPAGAALFPAEAVQLTDEALRLANDQTDEVDVVALFGFENSTAATAKNARRSGACKAFPGDWNYPKKLVWNVFDLLLGGALIKTTPIAAPCYKSSGVYDEAKCAGITKEFTTAELQ